MKRLICFFVVSLVLSSSCMAADEGIVHEILEDQLSFSEFSDLDDFLSNAELSDFAGGSSTDFLIDIITGNEDFNLSNIFSLLLQSIFGLLFTVAKGAGVMLAAIVICGLLQSFHGEGENNVSKTAKLIAILTICAVAIPIFISLVKDGLLTVEKMTSFIRVATPIMSVILLAGGKGILSAAFPVSIMVCIGIFNELIKLFFLPLLYCYTALSCAGCIYEGLGLSKLAAFFKSIFNWGLGLCLTVFTSVLAIQKTALSIGDGLAVNTVKYTVSSAVPIVGKILSDTADIFLGCAGAVKSAFGILGIVVAVSICLIPTIKIAIYALFYKLLSALCAMLGDKTAEELLEGLSGACYMAMALSFSTMFLFIMIMSVFSFGGGS